VADNDDDMSTIRLALIGVVAASLAAFTLVA
jgi:hypothetical protein